MRARARIPALDNSVMQAPDVCPYEGCQGRRKGSPGGQELRRTGRRRNNHPIQRMIWPGNLSRFADTLFVRACCLTTSHFPVCQRVMESITCSIHRSCHSQGDFFMENAPTESSIITYKLG